MRHSSGPSAFLRAIAALSLLAAPCAQADCLSDPPRLSARMTSGVHGRYASVAVPGQAETAVKDLATGLVWKHCEEGLVWQPVKSKFAGAPEGYCRLAPGFEHPIKMAAGKALAADFGAWRLPTRDELESLLEKNDQPGAAQVSPAFDPTASPQTFLSSTTCTQHINESPQSPTVTMVGVVSLNDGTVGRTSTDPADPGANGFLRLVHK